MAVPAGTLMSPATKVTVREAAYAIGTICHHAALLHISWHLTDRVREAAGGVHGGSCCALQVMRPQSRERPKAGLAFKEVLRA